MHPAHEYDLIIAGGGLSGASLALALSGAGRIALIEAVSPPAEMQSGSDDRALALALSSQRILHGLGVWTTISRLATPIEHIHVSDRRHFGVVHLHAGELHLPALGYVVPSRLLGQALMQRIRAVPGVELICPARVTGMDTSNGLPRVTLVRDGRQSTISGRLVIAADGTRSRLRDMLGIKATIKDYNQTAIVTSVTPGRKHGNTAWERFTAEGPVALLPLADNRCALVFTVQSRDAERYMSMDEDGFLSTLRLRFGNRLGRFRHLGARTSYPLQFLLAAEQVRERVVLLGNTAHTLHPNGAQGFNLCLRDVAGLAEVLLPVLQRGGNPGELYLLRRYQESRRVDQKRVACFSDGLATLFYSDLPHKVLSRNFGMALLNIWPPCRRTLALAATGLYGKQPALVRGTV